MALSRVQKINRLVDLIGKANVIAQQLPPLADVLDELVSSGVLSVDAQGIVSRGPNFDETIFSEPALDYLGSSEPVVRLAQSLLLLRAAVDANGSQIRNAFRGVAR